MPRLVRGVTLEKKKGEARRMSEVHGESEGWGRQPSGTGRGREKKKQWVGSMRKGWRRGPLVDVPAPCEADHGSHWWGTPLVSVTRKTKKEKNILIVVWLPDRVFENVTFDLLPVNFGRNFQIRNCLEFSTLQFWYTTFQMIQTPKLFKFEFTFR